MAVFKCKMCGGTIEFEQGATVGICDSCGTKQTLPKIDDERRANLYDRANHFRRNNEFDKASGIYEQILEEDTQDAEAYWSLVLCRYGIEYVEDPKTHKRVPTVNRTQYTSIFDDDNYRSALQYADGYQRAVYEEEADAINEIQKGILSISQKEEPFDVFICYKEADSLGNRTRDSVLANDLYHQLTQEGFKVFFSRITLEDKLGTAYEPYIFAALNSARVMVALGTKPEYFNAAWVKNEWSRYLALIKNGANKTLIPAYRDMDPYDLPEEFSHLQAQDMSKLGFMQDLIRGIKKLVDNASTVKNAAAPSAGVNTQLDRMLKNGETYVSLKNWDSAKEAYQAITKEYPEAYQGWWGLIVAHTHSFTVATPDTSYDTLEEWFRYVSQLSDRNILSRLQKSYFAYLAQEDIRKDLQKAEQTLKPLLQKTEGYYKEFDSIIAFQKATQAEFDLDLKTKKSDYQSTCNKASSAKKVSYIFVVLSAALVITSVILLIIHSLTAISMVSFAIAFLFIVIAAINNRSNSNAKDRAEDLKIDITRMEEKGSESVKKAAQTLKGRQMAFAEIDKQIAQIKTYQALSEEEKLSYFIAIENNKHGGDTPVPPEVDNLRSKAFEEKNFMQLSPLQFQVRLLSVSANRESTAYDNVYKWSYKVLSDFAKLMNFTYTDEDYDTVPDTGAASRFLDKLPALIREVPTYVEARDLKRKLNQFPFEAKVSITLK